MTQAFHHGDEVRVTLPDDVEAWWSAEVRTWEGIVIAVNGDSVDVTTPGGDVEPVDHEYVHPLHGAA